MNLNIIGREKSFSPSRLLPWFLVLLVTILLRTDFLDIEFKGRFDCNLFLHRRNGRL